MIKYHLIKEFKNNGDTGQLSISATEKGAVSLSQSADLEGWGSVYHDISIPQSAQYDLIKFLLMEMASADLDININTIKKSLVEAGHEIRETRGD